MLRRIRRRLRQDDRIDGDAGIDGWSCCRQLLDLGDAIFRLIDPLLLGPTLLLADVGSIRVHRQDRLSRLAQRFRQAEVPIRIVGRKLEIPLVRVRRLLELLRFAARVGEVVPGHRIRGIQDHRRLEARDRLVELALLEERLAHLALHAGLGRVGLRAGGEQRCEQEVHHRARSLPEQRQRIGWQVVGKPLTAS